MISIFSSEKKAAYCCLTMFILSIVPNKLFTQNLYPYGDIYPLSLYALYNDFGVASQNHWNGGHSYHSSPTLPYYYDSCSTYNLSVMARLSSIDSISMKWSQPTDTTIKEIQNQAIRNNISWWDLPEEMRYWKSSEMQIVQDYTSLTRAHDSLQRPNYMYIPGHYEVSAIENYVPYLDILPASCYTRYQKLPHAYTRWSIERTKEAILNQGYTIGKDYINDEKTVMAILEIYETDSLLTEEGTWHDFWMSVACDVKGIVAFSHYYRDKSPTLIEAWDTLNDAVSLFKANNIDKVLLEGYTKELQHNIISGPLKTPAFLVNNSPDTIQFEAIKLLAKDWNDSSYVFAINSSDSEIVYTVEDTAGLITYAKDIVKDLSMNFVGGSYTDTLQALDVAIYKLKYIYPTGIRTSDNKTIKIRPNPLSNIATIQLPQENHHISIYDIMGNKVREFNGSGPTIIERGDLTKGTYFLKSESAKNSLITKLVIQ